MKTLLFIAVVFPVMVFAQEIAPEVVKPEWFEALPSSMQAIAEKLGAFMDGAIIGGLGVVLEFVLRMIPSKKPLSIAHGIASMIRIAGSILSKVADGLDRVLPQKIK